LASVVMRTMCLRMRRAVVSSSGTLAPLMDAKDEPSFRGREAP